MGNMTVTVRHAPGRNSHRTPPSASGSAPKENDRSVAETARILQIPPGTVRSRTFYGLRALHRVLAAHDAMPSPVGASGEFMIAATKVSLPLGRRLAGYGLAAAAAPFLTLVLGSLRRQLDPTTDVLAFLLDVSRLQAGALPVFPRPADLGRLARVIRDRCPRPPRHVRASDQPHAIRFRNPAGSEPVVPPGSRLQNKRRVS
jgi:hypothetical protein